MTKPANYLRMLLLRAALVTLLCGLAVALNARTNAPAEPGGLQGTIFMVDGNGARLSVAGAAVKITSQSTSAQTSSDQDGLYRFNDMPEGLYRLEVTAPGLSGTRDITIASGEVTDGSVQVQLRQLQQSVNVSAEAPAVNTEPTNEGHVNRSVVLDAPNRYDQFDTLLPLIPGVVRGPDGLINMKGARASQGGALLNSANITDPATGNPALNLPIDVVESVSVISNPYDPEYSRLAGAVSNVDTTTSNFDAFHFSIQNILPRPRKRNGDFVGLESVTPRLTLTGPLIKGKIAFTQSFEYRFVRVPVSSLPPLQRDIKYEGFNSFSQLDVNLSARQSMTASLAIYPQRINYFGLNTFTPQPSTPDVHQSGYMAYLQHRWTTGDAAMLVSQFSYKVYDTDVTANSHAPYDLFIETTTGGVFDRQRRNTYRANWQETYHFSPVHFLGTHEFKAGLDVARSNYDGRVQLLPVTIFGVSEQPIEQIQFGPTSRFNVHQNEAGWFFADRWHVVPRLSVELGLRFDYDSVTEPVHAAPRIGFSLLLTSDAKTLLKGGLGLFYDRVPLNIASFPYLPDRTVSDIGALGESLASYSYINTIAGHLKNPRSLGWNVELDREVTSSLAVRAGFNQRDTTRDFVINPEQTLGLLSVSNSGSSFYREFQVSGRYKFRQNTLNASYVRSKAYGNLNDFNQFFGNNATAVIEPDGKGPLPFDAPNRVLLWGQFEAPLKLRLMPVFDMHTGFPYSLTDEYRNFIGPRDSERFPRFNSFDMQITRPISLPFPHKDMKARIGVSVFNLFNHFNPRDAQSDIDSQRFGALFNGVGRTFRGKFVLEF